MNKVRSFIAIEIPEGIKKDVFEIQEKLRKTDADVGWTRPEGIHLTLKFLGDVAEEKLEDIMKAIENAVKVFPPFSIEISGIGAFPGPKYPRVIWIGMKDNNENALKNLQNRIEKETEKLGFKTEKRDFTPHLTLGRVRSQKNRDSLLKAMEEFDRIELGALNVEGISLIKSEIRPKGALYSELFKVSLK